MDKARSKGKPIGRPNVVDKVDAELVVSLREAGKSWAEIAQAHPAVKSSSGKKVRPSVGSIRRAFSSITNVRSGVTSATCSANVNKRGL